MNQITNSPIKEAMRQQNENAAKFQEEQIRNKLKLDVDQLIRSKKRMPGGVCVVLAIGIGLLFGTISQNMYGFLVGAVIGIAIYIGLVISVKRKNSSIDANISSLRGQAPKDIQNAYMEADRRTVQQINAYDKEVKQYCQQILQNSDKIKSMVQHNTDMFQRMVSHADAASNIRFVEADFSFKVNMTGVTYSYQSRYTNPQDDFNFDKQRFRNLNKETECEGLARALTSLTKKQMMGLYPPNSLHITISHIDADVTMHFKAANKNFIAAQNIF